MVDDLAVCKTEVETKCEDETSGYTTSRKLKNWAKEICTISRRNVKKFTPTTGFTKEPRKLCTSSGCGFEQGPK